MKTFSLHLIRHGLTQGNIDRVYVGGGLDMPLCERGAQNLRELAGRFRYPEAEVLFASPMLRAAQTADILYPGMRRVVLEDLRECRFGVYEGRGIEELAQDENYAKWLDPQSGFVPEGGESGGAFARRCAGALHGMLEAMMKSGVREAVCVTHGGVIMSMLAQRAVPRKAAWDWRADNGCGYTVRAGVAMMMRDGLVEAAAVIPEGYLDARADGEKP